MAFKGGEERGQIFGGRGEDLGTDFEGGSFDFFEWVVYFFAALKVQWIL